MKILYVLTIFLVLMAQVQADWLDSLIEVGTQMDTFVKNLILVYNGDLETDAAYASYKDAMTELGTTKTLVESGYPSNDQLQQSATSTFVSNMNGVLTSCAIQISNHRDDLIHKGKTTLVWALANTVMLAVTTVCHDINNDAAIESYHKRGGMLLQHELAYLYENFASGQGSRRFLQENYWS